MRKKYSAAKLAAMRDSILSLLDSSIAKMPLRQASSFLEDLEEDTANLRHAVQDEISSIIADVKCTCGERGRVSLHTKMCAKTKAVK